MVEDNIIEGTLKYRDGKKWKQRWAVLNKLSPVADVLQLQLYRDSRDRARGAATKASLALPNSLALTTGFTLDKECHTLALLCKNLSLILAFDSRDRLLQWNSKISFTLGQEQQFLVQLVQVPSKSRLHHGPCRMHIRNHRFCLTSGTPPRLLAAWALMDLRRYGVVDGRFVWDGGSKSGRGTGVHLAISDTPNDITRALDLASKGALGSNSRRGSSVQASSGTIQRDAAMWLRDVGNIDMCQYSEVGDTLSINQSEIGSILSPRSEYASERRQDCDVTTGTSYITGSSSSSGSLLGEEPGWWSSTWGSRKGSTWEVAPSPIPESLYDSPRLFPHSKTTIGATHSVQSFHTHSLKSKNKHPPFQQQPLIKANPMDNYDIPKNHYQHYDVPRKFSAPQINHFDSTCLQHGSGIDTCGKMLCWAGALMCRRGYLAGEQVESVKVDGQGRMPVLDANTGTLLKGQSFNSWHEHISKSGPCHCHENSECKTFSRVSEPENSASEYPIYAVVDKTKKSIKPRMKTPPPSPFPLVQPVVEDQTPTNASVNYENIAMFQAEKSSDNQETIKLDDDQCYQCGGVMQYDDTDDHCIRDTVVTEPEIVKTLSNTETQEDAKCCSDVQETHYLVMGPGDQCSEQSQSHYLCMKNHSSSSKSQRDRTSSIASAWRPGRSLSLARNNTPLFPALRRSTSADSILHEPLTSSQYDTPDLTPNSTPMTSPPVSPFRTSTPRTDYLRGRQRVRFQGKCNHRCKNINICLSHLSQSNLSEIIFLSSSPNSQTTSSLTQSSNCTSHLSINCTTSDSMCIHNDITCVINPVVNAYTIPSNIPCHEIPILRRSSSMPGKSANRDSASSSDSGVCESPKPHERVLLSHCLHNSLPRGPRHKHHPSLGQSQLKSGINNESCRELGTVTGDTKSSSSGTSDISDYLDTLSLSSHSSSDHERLLGRASVTTLRPRSGREYSRFDRSALEAGMLPPVGEVNITTAEKK